MHLIPELIEQLLNDKREQLKTTNRYIADYQKDKLQLEQEVKQLEQLLPALPAMIEEKFSQKPTSKWMANTNNE